MTRELDSNVAKWREWLARLAVLLTSGAIGALLWTLPFGQYLEAHFGLWWSFKMRGAMAAPAEVVVVPINDDTAKLLAQPSVADLDEWDRSLFAAAIKRLANNGASVIALDIAFNQESRTFPEGDKQLAKAIAKANNVILMRWLEQRHPSVSSAHSIAPQLDRIVDPIRKLSNSAAALAPWLLDQSRERVDYFPMFPQVAGRIAPTLPVVALYLHHRSQGEVASPCTADANFPFAANSPTANSSDHHAELNLIGLQQGFAPIQLREPGPTPSTPCGDGEPAWLKRLRGSTHERLFNFYGRAGTLVGMPFHELVGVRKRPLTAHFQGKAVFIGVARDEIAQPFDSFRFPFLDRDGGGRISGVELAATAFANLLHNEDVKQIAPLNGSLLLLGFGMVVGLLGYLSPTWRGIAIISACCLVYGAFAHHVFATDHLWLPLFVPLLIQAPVAIGVGWQLRYLKAKHGKQLYGEFVPRHARVQIDRAGRISTEPQLLYAVCLHSDIAGYSGLAERFRSNPTALKRLEREYWDEVDQALDSEGGERLEIAGDGMTAIWKGGPLPELRQRACRASLNILGATERFRDNHPDTPFKTRVGLHAGLVALGNIGSRGHYTLAAGGDVATTAARLENDVNKLFGTRLVVSHEARAALPDIKTRRLGRFILRGRTSETVAYEIRGVGNGTGPSKLADSDMFEAALILFERAEWVDTLELFNRILARCPNDGPARFYKQLTALYLDGEQAPSDSKKPGVIDMNVKWIQADLRG